MALWSLQARGEPVTSVVLTTGEYGMRKEVPHGLEIGVEVRSPWTWTVVRPIAGGLTSSGGGTILYAGIVADFALPLHLQLSPGFAPAWAFAGAEGDLGSAVEFRSSLEVSVAAGERARVAVGISHISNARLGFRNPGVEVLTVGFAFPARN